MSNIRKVLCGLIILHYGMTMIKAMEKEVQSNDESDEAYLQKIKGTSPHYKRLLEEKNYKKIEQIVHNSVEEYIMFASFLALLPENMFKQFFENISNEQKIIRDVFRLVKTGRRRDRKKSEKNSSGQNFTEAQSTSSSSDEEMDLKLDVAENAAYFDSLVNNGKFNEIINIVKNKGKLLSILGGYIYLLKEKCFLNLCYKIPEEEHLIKTVFNHMRDAEFGQNFDIVDWDKEAVSHSNYEK